LELEFKSRNQDSTFKPKLQLVARELTNLTVKLENW